MYETIDYLEATADQANKVINQEREFFRPFYLAILKYLRQDTGCLLSGPIAVDTYIKNKVDEDAIVQNADPFNIYVPDAFETAKKLSAHIYNSLHKEFPDECRILAVLPIVPGYEYSIRTVRRTFCFINNIGKHRDIDLNTIINTTKIGGVELLNPEILLIDIYRLIFLADDETDQQRWIDVEEKLFKRFINNVKKGKLDVVGNAEEPLLDFETNEEFVVTLRKLLIGSLHKDSMIVGPQAVQRTSDYHGLQFCTSKSTDDIRQVLKFVSEQFTEKHYEQLDKVFESGTKVMPRLYNYSLSLPVDTNLRRLRIQFELERDGRTQRTLIADIFTAGQYDILQDHPYVVLRFIFVDIWTFMMLAKLKEMPQHVAQQHIDDRIELALKLHKKIPPLGTNYFGHYISDLIYKKQLVKHIKKDATKYVYQHYYFVKDGAPLAS